MILSFTKIDLRRWILSLALAVCAGHSLAQNLIIQIEGKITVPSCSYTPVALDTQNINLAAGLECDPLTESEIDKNKFLSKISDEPILYQQSSGVEKRLLTLTYK